MVLQRTKKFVQRNKYVGFFFIILHVAGFVSSIDAIMSTRTPQGAIAWAISLNTFPAIALPAYWVFGKSEFRGYIQARQEDESELSPIAESIKKDKSIFRSPKV
ncbi:MAG: cardiolipin synthase, partial [Desulfobulbia bacterium]